MDPCTVHLGSYLLEKLALHNAKEVLPTSNAEIIQFFKKIFIWDTSLKNERNTLIDKTDIALKDAIYLPRLYFFIKSIHLQP
jgi:hypothetical protein